MSDIELSIQPAYTTDGRKINYAEVLVRKYMNIEGPQRILSYVSDTETEVEFDMKVLSEVIRYIRRYPDISYPIGLNLCGRTIGIEGIGKTIVSIIDESYIDKNKIIIEINEGTDFSNKVTWDNISDIHEAGIVLALDDFGNQNSNFSALLSEKFDILKIDKQFIDNIGDEYCEHEDSSRTIFEAMLNLCKRLGIRSIVEGVESKKQLEYTKSLGCDSIQGFLFCKPIPMDEYDAYKN